MSETIKHPRLTVTALAAAAITLCCSCRDGGSEPAEENTEEACRNTVDDDGDGYVDCNDQDCYRFTFCYGDTMEEPDTAPPDVEHDLDAADVSDQEAESAACSAPCDCPGGTICTVEGVCEGIPCTDRCSDEDPCPCDRTCSEGFCEPAVGTLDACTYNCHCSGGQYCASGRCVVSCGLSGWNCDEDADCEPCDLVCNPHTLRCVEPGECSCSALCPDDPPGEVCLEGWCGQPPGTRYAPASGLPKSVSFSMTSFPTLTVPTGTMVNSLVMVVSITEGDMDDFYTMTLAGPGGDEVDVGGFWTECVTDRFKAAFPLTETPREDLSLFEGRDGGGVWTLYIHNQGDGSASLIDWALYIE